MVFEGSLRVLPPLRNEIAVNVHSQFHLRAGFADESQTAILSDNACRLFRLSTFLRDSIFDNGAQDFCDTPSLRETSARVVWRIAIENLGNMTKAGFGQMGREKSQPLPNLILNFLFVAKLTLREP